ncbi:acetyltransferase [Methanomethylovorans hollandica DSM 15978]|uniref:Acetyltransferase n=1 Tax=Methanomethylovorans hollandica (strain DSM 15978 / NBRC 107637 / DMS1) TaxID=867904 RepID=L0KVG3_METHD|nr:GNAT family N-acetyltransferase [Methanomethylovorans hollandica]AGB49126.1 acetyltransferase [Methanomethylovorans hollandica DSM 15978]
MRLYLRDRSLRREKEDTCTTVLAKNRERSITTYTWDSIMQGIEKIHQAGDISYALFVSSEAVDYLYIEIGTADQEGFSYFHQKFGMPYKFLLKKSIESGHFLFVSISGKDKLIGFARFEKLEEHIDKEIKGKMNVVQPSLFLLRSMEVHSSFRNCGIGRVLFSTAVYYLQGNVLTVPDNKEAANFFKKKLGFTEITDTVGIYKQKYEGHLILPYPKAVTLWHEIASKYPRILYPELIDLYESLKFRHNMGKAIPCNDIYRFENLLAQCNGMLANVMENDMHRMLIELR